MFNISVTKNEKKIIDILKKLKPFEKIEIVADQNGRFDYYIVYHSYKEILKD